MLSHRGGWRVAIVVRPLDRALGLLRLGVIPLVLAGVSFPVLKGIAEAIGAAPSGSPLLVLGIAVALAYVLVLQVELVRSHVDSILARLRRRPTLNCHQDVARARKNARVACWLTPQALRAPLFRYDQQNRAVRALTDACRTEPGQYWFLEGRSGTGKTRTGLLFVQELVRDLELLEFGDRSYLYDFGDPEFGQEAFLEALGTPRHDRAVVLVDNFQQVHRDALGEVTQRLLDKRLTERLLVFLTRPADAWNLSPSSEVLLVSKAKAAGRHLQLTGPPSESVARSLAEFDRTGAQLLWDLEDDPVASAPQLHLAQVMARNPATPAEVSTIIRLLAGEIDDAAALDLVRVLAVITALSMHRGAFSGRDFRRAARTANDGVSGWSAVTESFRMRATLRRFRRIGLVSRGHRRRARYEFHEAIAKLCIDRLSTLQGFQIPFTLVGRSRLREHLSGGDALRGWLTAVEVGAQEAAEANFDAAIASGPYTRMLRCLQRAGDRYTLSAPMRLQLAILLDRTGDFGASREEFTDDLVGMLDPSSELSMIFTTTRVEASHDRESIAGLGLLCSHPDRLVAIVGEYWKLHIAAHRGSFASEKLFNLATEALELIKARDSHWLNYSLGRMHFDSLRHHYLEGGGPEPLQSRERRALGTYLGPRLASYGAAETLYTKAHLVGFVLLPQRALFHEPVTYDQAALAGVEPKDVATDDDLVRTMQRLYGQAQDQFSRYGDREAAYLQADVLNADIIDDTRDVDALTDRLYDYQSFIADTGFKDIASYPHLYFLRWHVLKRYRALAAGASNAVDEELNAAWWHLRQIFALDAEVGNDYGLMRAKLLEVLLQWLLDPPAADELSSLKAQMAARGYGREERLLAHLAARGPLPILELRRIFRCYPFVHQ